MKILHVLYSGLGGHGNVFFSMVSADKDKEYQYEALFNGVENIRDEYIQKCDVSNIQWKFIKKGKAGFSVNFYKQFSKVIKQSNVDIVFLHSSSYILPAIIANLLAKKKKKIIIRETQANNLKTKQNWFWLSMAFLFADKIVCLSEEYKSEIKRKLIGVYNENKVAVIPNGIDLDVYKPSQQIKLDCFTIGMQSRLTNNKDHITLIKAFALFKKNKNGNIKLSIAGDGPCRTQLAVLTTQLNITDEVKFTGMLKESELVKYLQTLDLYVHASYGETMSTAIMQAMACSLPIVASDVPGINNMITHDETGCLVAVQNELELATALDQLYSNKSKAALLGQNAFNYAQEHYSNLAMFKKYKKLFSA